jgi:hypothetical protein
VSEIYVVIGTLRSGTSLTAGGLHMCGVPFFPSTEHAINGNAGDEWNRGGQFADRDFYSLVAPRLPGLTLPDPAWEPDDDALGLIADMVATRSATPRWGFKGVHSWIGAAVLQQLGYRVRVINTARALAQSQASYLARIGPDSAWQVGGAEFIAGCKAQADAFYAAFTGPKMIADFETMLADPAAGMAALADFCGVPVTQEAIDFVNVEWRRFE